MISFAQHLSDDINLATQELEKWALAHWDSLNPKIKDGSRYKKKSLIGNCLDFRTAMQSKSLQAKLGVCANSAVQIDRFFDELQKDNFRFLKEIIVCPPSSFRSLRARIVAIMDEKVFYDDVKGQTLFGEALLTHVFKYGNFRGSSRCVDFFVSDLEITKSTCAYCNIVDTEAVNINPNPSLPADYAALFDIDHFFNKARSPFFALSFFNLVPTCIPCNSRIKLSKTFSIETHINPFYESFDDIYEFGYRMSGEITLRHKSPKPNDETAKDLLIHARTQNKLNDLVSMLSYYTKYSRRALTSVDSKEQFVDYFANRVPLRQKDILSVCRGKLYRDVLKKVDMHNKIIDFK